MSPLFAEVEPEPHVKGIERMAREATTLLEKSRAEYLHIAARTILNRCASARMPFTWTINPYRGCEYGCRYCYARYTHEFMGLPRWEDFEEKIYVKRDAARLLARELTPGRLRGQSIALGTATDPYQPAERRFRVTRSLLSVMTQASGVRLSITTKSDLVTRDIDLLRRIALRNSLQVNLTVTTLDRRLARLLEFRASTPDRRLHALRTLREAGIVAGIALSPILPDITDDRDSLGAVIAAAHAHGATHLFWNVLFLKPSAQQAFFSFLERHSPDLTKRYAARFARSAFLDRAYQERISALITELKRQHGFPDRTDFELPAPIHETDQREAEQLPLFQIATSATLAPSNPPRVGPSATLDIGQSRCMGYSGHTQSQPISSRGPTNEGPPNSPR